MLVRQYTSTDKDNWDSFIDNAKNGHFFFKRDYMEYHSDRFDDYSLIFFDKKDKIIALLPANREGNVVFSHKGLTFGGFIVDSRMKAAKMLEVFDLLISFLKENNIIKLHYKCIPYIYHKVPAEEYLYSLFINKAKLVRVDVSSSIFIPDKIPYRKDRKEKIRKAKKNGLKISEVENLSALWDMISEIWRTIHNVKPVHSLREITLLKSRFPSNIKAFIASKDEIPVAGALVFENIGVVHTQYLVNSNEGRQLGALDLIIDYLLTEKYLHKKYFSFGISTENAGQYLNVGLIQQKEGFGARSTVHNFYEIDLQ